jgi:Glycosyl hydrolase family 12
MIFTPRTLALAVTGVAGAACITGMVVPTVSSQAATTTTLCQTQTLPVASGAYTVQNNEWGSSAPECITTHGIAAFTVANSAIRNATNGAPGGYPSIYQGCHWGNCTSGGLSGNPVQASAITTGKVTTSWSTTQPGGSSAYDVAYDIWFNKAPSTTGQPDGAELMIWINHQGGIEPYGSQVSTATVSGRSYQVWFGQQGWNTISYSMTTGTTSVQDLDIGKFVADAISRGWIQKSWYLIDVEAGFEIWQGGAGLATDSFAVNVRG